jgi:hypothetical protein
MCSSSSDAATHARRDVIDGARSRASVEPESSVHDTTNAPGCEKQMGRVVKARCSGHG